jgi:hypothetical protein
MRCTAFTEGIDRRLPSVRNKIQLRKWPSFAQPAGAEMGHPLTKSAALSVSPRPVSTHEQTPFGRHAVTVKECQLPT